MKNIIKIVNVPFEDMKQVIKQIIADEIKNAIDLFKPDCNKQLDEVLTRDEVCKLLKVSTTTLFHWNNQNILVNKKVGRRVFYKRSDVLNKMDSNLKN
jgi:hypothetical protein